MGQFASSSSTVKARTRNTYRYIVLLRRAQGQELNQALTDYGGERGIDLNLQQGSTDDTVLVAAMKTRSTGRDLRF